MTISVEFLLALLAGLASLVAIIAMIMATSSSRTMHNQQARIVMLEAENAVHKAVLERLFPNEFAQAMQEAQASHGRVE